MSTAHDQPGSTSIIEEDNSIHSRNYLLDVLRGIAVLGSLFIGIWVFGGFTTNIQDGLVQHSKGLNYWLFGSVNLAFYGKMSALICIVFGAGMVMYLSKAQQEKETAPHELFIRRQMWLIVLGIINSIVFLFTHDFLFHLAVAGLIIFPFFRLPAKSLFIAALVITAIYSGKFYWNYTDDQKAYKKYAAVMKFEKKAEKDSAAKAKIAAAPVVKDTLSKQQKKDKAAWEAIVMGMKPDPKKDEAVFKKMRKPSYSANWDHMLPIAQTRQAQWTYQFGIWDLAGMMLLGMFLLKAGFFHKHYPTYRLLLFTIIALLAGLALGGYRLYLHHLSLMDYEKFIKAWSVPQQFYFPFERAFLAIGYTTTIMLLLRLPFLKTAWNAFEKAGKMALTIYLMQSIICTTYFAGFAMGYFGRLAQYQLYIFAGQVIIVQLAFAVYWFRYYQYGPAEWLLRSLMQLRILPNKKEQDASPEPGFSPLNA